jgi:uncharacterized protein (DUF1330 family)
MSVLIIANIAVENPANLGPYQQAAAASMEEFGIRLVGKAAPTPMLEGRFDGIITVALEAESEEKARAWYGSESYAKAIAARSEDAKFTIAIVPSAGG